MDLTLKNGRPNTNDDGGSVILNGYWADNYGNKGHSPLFQNVVFESNQARWSSQDNYRGGGAVRGRQSNPSFRDVTFKGNFFG